MLKLESKKKSNHKEARSEKRAFIFLASIAGASWSMRKARSKTGKRSAKKGSASRGSGKTVNLEELRRKLACRVAERAPEMVNATIAEVMKGEYQPMKYLFEMIGLYPAGTEEERPEKDSLAQTLLRRLNLPEESEPEAATESPAEAPVAGLNTVE